MTTLAALARTIALSSLFVACAGEEPPRPVLLPLEPPTSAAARDEPAPGEVVAPAIDVVGVVATALSERVAGRPVVLRDGGGEPRVLVTDGSGVFQAGGVVPPYDVAVLPASSGAATIAYLGLRRSDPWIELDESSAAPTDPPSQAVRVAVRAAACDGRRCRITVTSASPSGAGATTTACEPGADATVVAVDHRWRTSDISSSERIDVHALVVDDRASSFAYAHAGGLVAAPGELVDAGTVEPAPVALTEAVSVGALGGRGALSDWRWSTAIYLDPSGGLAGAGAGVELALSDEAVTTLKVPLIAGAKLHARVAASHPRSDGQGGFARAIEAWSGARPLSVHPIELEVAPGPEIVRPAVGGAVSRRGLGFAWRSLGVAALMTLAVFDTTRGGVRFRLTTTEEEVTRARLAGLGIPELMPGDHVLELTTAPGVIADEVVSPDPGKRKRRVDPSRPGARTSLRTPFEVTP